MLTPKQRQLLMFIHDRIKEDGVSPSFDEMKEALGLASKSGIHRLITALEERGFLQRLPNRARALEVVKMPEDATLVRGVEPANDAVAIPLLGRIAAGTPITAIQHEVDRIPAPPQLIGKGEHFALEVRGDSMVEAGILDGDFVIVRKSNAADDGDIVVALVDQEEATLKTLRRRRAGMIALEPANAAYETRELPADRVDVQGRLVGLIRRYD